MTSKNQLNIGVLLYGYGHHKAAWLMPNCAIKEIGESQYYQRLAQIVEAGCLDAVFFVYNQYFSATNAVDIHGFWLNPLINLTAISQVTKGRIGWNLGTLITD